MYMYVTYVFHCMYMYVHVDLILYMYIAQHFLLQKLFLCIRVAAYIVHVHVGCIQILSF